MKEDLNVLFEILWGGRRPLLLCLAFHWEIISDLKVVQIVPREFPDNHHPASQMLTFSATAAHGEKQQEHSINPNTDLIQILPVVLPRPLS